MVGRTKRKENGPEENKRPSGLRMSQECVESSTLTDPEQDSGNLSAGWEQCRCSGGKEGDLKLS